MTLATEVSFIDAMQKAEEEYDMELYEVNSHKNRVKNAVMEALQDCNLSRKTITDIQSTCAGYEIHIGNTMSKEEREILVKAINKRLNCGEYAIKIIAFYS